MKLQDELGLKKNQIKGWINRHNKGTAREEAGLPSKGRGRKPAITLQDYKYENNWLERKKSLHFNPKTILRLMNKYGLLSEIRRRKKYKQMGQQLHKYENLLNRNFVADRPNVKWVTDISYIHTAQGVLYLSMIRNLFDNSIVAYKTGTEQTVNLVLNTIKLAMEKETVARELHLHSDQGFQ